MSKKRNKQNKHAGKSAVKIGTDIQTHEARVTENGRIISDHPSNKITPAKLKSLFADAENGDILTQSELFFDIEEQDGDIAANMATRKRAVLTLDWQITEPRHATPQEAKYKQEIDELFHQFSGLEDLVVDMMDAVGHGFSALEIDWQFVDGKWQPAGFLHRPPSWFKLDKDDNLLLKTPDNPMGEPLRPLGWVVHRHKSRSVQLARMGLYRTLAWLYMFKHYSVHDFAEFLELYGMPIRIGKYGAGATPEEKRTLLRALAQIGHNSSGIMPESMEIELHNAAGNVGQHNPFIQMVDWCEKQIARLILGQTLTSGADGKSSTNALGQVHNEVRRDLLVADAKQVSQTITKQIILPYLQINVDPTLTESRCPQFEFDTKEYEDLEKFANSLPKLVEVGLQIPERWAREKLGIPDLEDGETALAFAKTDTKAADDENAENGLENEQEKAAPEDGDNNSSEKTGKKSTALSATFGEPPGKCSCGCHRFAFSHGNEPEDKPQAMLDESLDEALLNVDFNRQLDPMVKTAMSALWQAQSFDDAAEKLAAVYPELSAQAQTQYLERALFLAELLGTTIGEQAGANP